MIAVFLEPVNVKELRQGTFDGCIVQPQRNESSILVQRVAKPERARL